MGTKHARAFAYFHFVPSANGNTVDSAMEMKEPRCSGPCQSRET